MRVPITYIASSGNTYSLMSNGIAQKSANYHSWKWNPEGTKLQYGERVSDFSKEAQPFDIELLVFGSEPQRRAKLNALHDDFECDVRNKQTGKIIWGDYYIDGYVVSSDTRPSENGIETVNKVKVYAPYPFWIQELGVSLPPAEEVESTFLDFPYDFMYDFTAPVVGEKIVKSDFPFESEFEMIIYGFADNPRITINGYSYVLYTTIPNGAYAIINSRANTVMIYNADGTKTNAFNFRNKTNSIFRKIPSGNLDIIWDATFGVDLKIYHERSEPRVEVVT